MHNRMRYIAEKPADTGKIILEQFLEELADEIIEKYETPLLRRILKRAEKRLKHSQINTLIEDYKNKDNIHTRRKIIKEDLRKYFAEYDTASVNGLVQFRLLGYVAYLEKTAEEMLFQYYAEKEYHDFIFLLRYFIGVQSARPDLIHLVVGKDGVYTLYNKEMENITDACMADFIMENHSGIDQKDDVLISALITLAPQHLVIHRTENIENTDLFQTIHNVFDKTEYCGGCPLCKNKIKH